MDFISIYFNGLINIHPTLSNFVGNQNFVLNKFDSTMYGRMICYIWKNNNVIYESEFLSLKEYTN